MGLLDNLFGGGQQPLQAQTGQQPQGGMFSGRMGILNDPTVALPLAGALMQPGNIGSNLGQGFALAGQGMETRKKLQQEQIQQNMTAKYLESQGADPALVEMAKSGGGAQALQAWQQTREKPLDELRLKTAQLQYEKLAHPSADDDEYGLTPIYGQDAQGNPIAFQPSKSGKIKQLELPDGTKLTPGVQKVDLGTSWGFVNRNGDVVRTEPKDVSGAASQTAIGKGQGEATVAYNSMASKMPGLETVVKKLDALSEKATYTLGGQAYDAGRRQIGMAPSEGAKARTEYISTVDNQILPLLRDTFGAAFTQKEGDTLRATLGDPDKSPQEKQLVLKSFIEQKRRDVEAMVRQSSGVQAPRGNPQGGGVVDYRDFFGGQ